VGAFTPLLKLAQNGFVNQPLSIDEAAEIRPSGFGQFVHPQSARVIER
jgi:hypothetical protein